MVGFHAPVSLTPPRSKFRHPFTADWVDARVGRNKWQMEKPPLMPEIATKFPDGRVCNRDTVRTLLRVI